MPTYEIQSPDGKTYEVTAPEGATQDQVLAYVKQQHVAAPPSAAPTPAPTGPQPSMMQTIMASPVGRFAHDAILQPISGLAGLLARADPTGGMIAPMAAKAEDTYQGSLSAQRNRPGYAKALSDAQAQLAARGGSGLTDQFIAPFTSAMAGTAGLITGGLNGSNAAADAQLASQGDYQKAHPIASAAAGLAGGLMAMPQGMTQNLLLKSAASPAAAAVPSIADLKSVAHQAYDRVDNAGHVVSDTAYDAMVNDLKSKLANEGIDKTLHPNAIAAYNRLAEAQGNPITFKGLDTLRKVSSDAIGASAMNKADQRLGYAVQNHIDDFVNGLKPADIMGATDPTSTIADLAEARDAWSRASQAQLIQNQIDKAGIKASANYSQSGVENALRQQFKSLALNDKAMARLAPEVREAVKDVAKGSPMGNILRFVGKYAPHGPVATLAGMGVGSMMGGVGGAAEGGLASLAVPMAGEAARTGATKITQAAAQKALQTAALGRAPAAAPAALSIPSLPGASQLPYGLLGSAPLLLRPQPRQ